MGLVEAVPRRVLVVYDGDEAALKDAPAHRLVALPLEYFGFALDYLDVSGPLPEGRLDERYAGIVTYLTDDSLTVPLRYRAWLLQQLDAGVRVAIVGQPGIPLDGALLARLGLEPIDGGLIAPVKIARRAGTIGFEAEPEALGRELPACASAGTRAGSRCTSSSRTARVTGPTRCCSAPGGAWPSTPTSSNRRPRAATAGSSIRSCFWPGPWPCRRCPCWMSPPKTGVASSPATSTATASSTCRSRPDRRLAGEVILTDILRRYLVPTTVSIIEGEIGASGLYREQSAKLEGIARQIFKLPHVEAASHSYSHPFDWDAAEHGRRPSEHEEAYLPIDGLQVRSRPGHHRIGGLHRSPAAPARQANPHVPLVGSAQPSDRAVAITRRAGLLNVNGGSVGSVGRVSPPYPDQLPGQAGRGRLSGLRPPRQREQLHQPLAGPVYGYRRAIEVFRYTDKPRRLKPLSLYYHFYSGSKPAGMVALREVHDWSLAQEIFPVWLSEYARKVEDFQRATLARTLDGGWELRRLGSLRTIRFDERLGWPELGSGSEVAALRELPQGRYASFVPGDRVRVRFQAEPPRGPIRSGPNGRVLSQTRKGDELTLRLQAEVPLEASVGGCQRGPARVVSHRPHTVRHTDPGRTDFTFTGRESGDVVVSRP